MFSSVLRRTSIAAALALAATTLVSGGVATGATTGASPAATSISIRVVDRAVPPGATTTIRGHLRERAGGPVAEVTMTLQARLRGDTEFLPIASVQSGPRGGVRTQVTPAATTKYRWVFAGDEAHRASRSGVAAVAVRESAGTTKRRPTSLSIRAERRVVRADGTSRIRGRLVSRKRSLSNQVVVLLSRPVGADGWGFVAAKQTRRGGGVGFGVQPAATTKYRLIFQGAAKFRKARSGVVRVGTRPTALSSAVSESTVSGFLTRAGAGYADQTVQLWGKPAGSTTRFAELASTVSGVDGSVSFTVAPMTKMRYFLYFPRTAEAPAAKSPTRTMDAS